jgi:hypothetical protein
LTVKQAFERYVDYKRAMCQPVDDLISRGKAHIVAPLGDIPIPELTAEQLRKWLSTIASAPKMVRSKKGKQKYGPEPTDAEAVRRRRSSANRVLGHAFPPSLDRGLVQLPSEPWLPPPCEAASDTSGLQDATHSSSTRSASPLPGPDLSTDDEPLVSRRGRHLSAKNSQI